MRPWNSELPANHAYLQILQRCLDSQATQVEKSNCILDSTDYRRVQARRKSYDHISALSSYFRSTNSSAKCKCCLKSVTLLQICDSAGHTEPCRDQPLLKECNTASDISFYHSFFLKLGRVQTLLTPRKWVTSGSAAFCPLCLPLPSAY